MTTSTTTTNINIVTPEQIAMCGRVYDEQGTAFYMVQSESDPTVEYTVKAIKVEGRYYVTCTCAAGIRGVACKHKKWAAAAAQIDKTQAKVEAMSRPTDVVKGVTTVATDVDSGTLARVTRASLANHQPSKSQVEQDYRHYNACTFRLMR